jgi:hypothetical protein
MYYLVNVDLNGMAAHLTISDVKCKKCCISTVMDETNNNTLWNCSKEDENGRSECEKGEGTDCEDGDSDTDW